MGRRCARLLVLLLFAPAASYGCGHSPAKPPTIDNQRLQNDLQRRLAKETGTIVDRVACPNDVPARRGAKLECNASFNGEADAIEVTLARPGAGPGEYRVRLKDLLLGKLETVVKRRFAARHVQIAALDCPDPQPQRRGHMFVCNIDDRSGRHIHLRVAELDDAGHLRFTLVR